MLMRDNVPKLNAEHLGRI